MRPLSERFEDKYIPKPNSGCWLWTANMQKNGYGKIGVENNKVEYAHRVSWRLFRGDVPKGVDVMHVCDVRCCVNPDHLQLGTRKDNMLDAVKKGRVNRKLTQDAVKIIRGTRRGKTVRLDLAKRFNVSPGHIGNVRAGRA